MQRLLDRVRIRGRDYRLIEDLDSGGVTVVGPAYAYEFPDRTAAYHFIGDAYRRLAADMSNAVPGATIELPMADGTTKMVTVMSAAPDSVVVIDQETGEQMRVPRVQAPPGQQPPAQPGQPQAQPGNQGDGPQVITPGYGTVSGLTLSRRHAEEAGGVPSATGKRRLTRHEVITEAETLIRNSLVSGTRIGLQELVEFLTKQYANSGQELYRGAQLAWEKVQWEGSEGSEGGAGAPSSLEELAEPPAGGPEQVRV